MSLMTFSGDQVLKEVARRFSEAVQVDGFVARLGGDEFVLILPFASDEDLTLDFLNDRQSLFADGLCQWTRRETSISSLLAQVL